MGVEIITNNIPDQRARTKLQEAVLKAIGPQPGDWRVEIREQQDSPSWGITISGPNDFYWSRRFFGVIEQNPSDDYCFIAKALSELFPRGREQETPVEL